MMMFVLFNEFTETGFGPLKVGVHPVSMSDKLNQFVDIAECSNGVSIVTRERRVAVKNRSVVTSGPAATALR